MFLKLLRENRLLSHVVQQKKTFPYPGTANRHDLVIFHGENTEFDINEAEKQLLSLMKLPTTIDGCHMILNQQNKSATCHKKLTLISFALMVEKCQVSKKTDFGIGTGRVGKLHAVTQKVKRTNTKGTDVKGKCHYHEFVYSLNSIIH